MQQGMMEDRDSRVAFIQAYHPINVLAGVISVFHFAKSRGRAIPERVIVLLEVPEFLSPEAALASQHAAEEILRAHGWDKVRVMRPAEMGVICTPDGVLSIAERVRASLGVEEAREVHFTHDVGGVWAQFLMVAYPKADRITFGDWFGTVVDPAYKIATATGNTERLNEVIGTTNRIEPQVAVLCLPVDRSASEIQKMELLIPSKEEVLQVLHRCSEHIREIEEFTQELLQSSSDPRVIFLPANFADAGRISSDIELEMYDEMLSEHLPDGASVIIKGHPISAIPIDEMLANRLQGRYQCVCVPRELCHYPIEIWTTLINQCQVVAAISHSAVSVQYLNGRKVLYGMTEDRIRKYFPEYLWKNYRDSRHAVSGMLSNLSSWDGQSVLWSNALSNDPVRSVGRENESEHELEVAQQLAEKGRWGEAFDAFQSLHSESPEDLRVIYCLGQCYFQLGKQEEAASCYFQAFSGGYEPIVTGLELLRMCIGRGDGIGALRICDELLRRFPEHPEVLAAQARLLREMNHPDVSEPLLQDAWLKHREYVRASPTAIFGDCASIDVRFYPLYPQESFSIGAESQFFGSAAIMRPGATIRIGERTQIGQCTLIAAGSIDIGDDILMAWDITLMDNDSHSLDFRERANDVLRCGSDYRLFKKDFVRNKDWSHVAIKPIRIENKVWIGYGCAILKGVTIGEGSIVASKSVVTKDIPPYSLVVGNPAKIIRKLSPP